MSDRFDLEQSIMKAWGTSDDIGLIYRSLGDSPMSVDEISNLLLGLEAQHNLRCQEMFGIFEDLIGLGITPSDHVILRWSQGYSCLQHNIRNIFHFISQILTTR